MRVALTRVKKQFFDGTHRVKSPDETYNEIAPLMDGIGVTEVTDITHLDRIGIPCFSAIRPGAAIGGVRVHSGKGKDLVQAKVSAMMEAIERHSGEYHGDPMDYASYEEIGLTRAVDPNDLILPRPLEMSEKIHWTPAWDLLNEEEVCVPSNAVFHPYDTLGMTMPLFRSDSNGLASGNVIEEAILHALLEVVERDALSVAEQKRDMGVRISVTQDGPVRELIDRFEMKGIRIHLWLLGGRSRLPTIAAAADDTLLKDPGLLVMGAGTHCSPEIAALRAVTEVAQSRATHLQGGRRNPQREMILKKAGYERMKRINGEWFRDADEISMHDLEDLSTPYFDDDIRVALQELEGHADRVCICNLSRTQVPVVRVIVPGLEVSHMDKARIRKPTPF